MPRKSASSAVQRGGTTDIENTSRRSTRSSSRHDSSGSITSRTRRSSTTAQTAASLAESRVTRSRNVSNRNRSSSPSESTRTRQTREATLESPASRVKTTRRSTGRVNYQESEGEEDMTSTTEKNEEEEYHVEDDLEESDSEESNKSRTRSRTTTKSPPKVRGRGRGRPPKAVKGKSRFTSAEDNFDDDDDDDEEEEEESDEKTMEESDTIDEVITRRSRSENDSESTRKTRGTKRKIQSDLLPVRSTRSGKTPKESTETDKIHLSSSTRQTRHKKISSETANVPLEDVDMKKENKTSDNAEDTVSTEDKKKRKLDVKKEAKKRIKTDDSNLENEKDENQEKLEKSESLQESAKSQQSDMELEEKPKEILSETCKTQVNNLISVDKTSSDELSNKINTTESMKSEISNSSASKGNSSIDLSEKICKDDSQTNDLMEVDNDNQTIGEKSSENLSIDTKNSYKESKNSENDVIKEKPIDSKERDYCTTKLTSEKETKSVIYDTGNSHNNITQASKEYENNSQSNSKISTECTNLVSTNVDDTKKIQPENEKLQDKLSVVAECTTKSDTLLLEKSDTQDSSKEVEGPSKPLEINLKDTENNATSNQKEYSSSCSIVQPSKISFPEKNATNLSLTEMLPVNGANISTEKSRNNNESDDILDMSKTSDNSASETENVAVESFSQAPSNTECLIKPNGAPNNLMQSSDSSFDLPNRKYVYNSSLSEDSKTCLQDKTFSLISYNLSAIPNESFPQNEKLLTELKRTNSDFICLQEIPKKYYDILESDLNSLGYKGLVSIPENKTRGLGTFYKTSSFNLKRQAGVSLQKIIDQDLETSSLENADKIAIRTFLQKCGYVLMMQFCTVGNDHTLTIANVFFPPSDISTHALQMSSLVREVVNFAADIARPHILCGSFNMKEGGVAYQLLREGYLNNEMIEELQKRKDVALPGKDNDTLVNLLWKAFQHPSSNLRSCYATVLGHELHLDGENSITSPDLLWYSSDSLETIGILDFVPVDKNNIDPVALKADIAYIC
ncbi:uncharacterized protein DDB_G0283697-like [Centruroides sculpturatus]|uniref:uncharacterized protein DDB_G0283697-like n=1 Tax=Centruroides sculpturatus TaxID=218467 RepID=UPI000C6E24A8|nr:uncharacterized protein DDB_G0283697-like [Centruroides sculpturatus]